MTTQTAELAARAVTFVSKSIDIFTDRLRTAVNTRTALLPEFLTSATAFGDIAFTITFVITGEQRGCDDQIVSEDSVRITGYSDNRDLLAALAEHFGSTATVDDDENPFVLRLDDLHPLVANYILAVRGLTPKYQVGDYPDLTAAVSDSSSKPPVQPTEICWSSQFDEQPVLTQQALSVAGIIPPEVPVDGLPEPHRPTDKPSDYIAPVEPNLPAMTGAWDRELVGIGA